MKERKRHVYNKEKLYALYKGDKYITMGTWFDITKRLNISDATMRYYLSNAYHKRTCKGKKRIVIIPIEELENEDIYD